MLSAGETASRDDRAQYLHQFVLHAALDAVEEQQWQTTQMNLGIVDKFNHLHVSLLLAYFMSSTVFIFMAAKALHSSIGRHVCLSNKLWGSLHCRCQHM